MTKLNIYSIKIKSNSVSILYDYSRLTLYGCVCVCVCMCVCVCISFRLTLCIVLLMKHNHLKANIEPNVYEDGDSKETYNKLGNYNQNNSFIYDNKLISPHLKEYRFH